MDPIRLTQYFRHSRDDVLDEVPDTAKVILDVGCGTGVVGARLRQRQACEVWGIESDPDAAGAARAVLDRVIETPVEAAAAVLPAGHFDTLIAADVLEHLPDPWGTLRVLARCLAPAATVLISLPNLQHHDVVRDLLRGRFTYVPAGILDLSHLRFFTRQSAIDLARIAGLTVERVTPIYATSRDRRAVRRRRPPPDLPPSPDVPLGDFYAQQFLIVARGGETPRDTSRVRVSIVMLTWNRVEVTRQAIDSLRASTRQPYELIVVDNGSTDGTPAYLDRLAREGVRVVRNSVNRGVAAGWNQGLRLATGDCLMVLNNDVLVAGDWLERMTRTAYQVPRAGLVGCRATAVGGPQLLTPDYADPADFPLFARRYATLAEGSWFELPRVVAVAMLWRREVYERVGEFDERFTPASFEDDDYSLRALKAGHRNLIANDVFIHHLGSASHAANSIEPRVVQEENRDRFLKKWGAAAAPIIAARWADYDEHLALLAPDQFALPGWAVDDLPPRAVARHLARVGRRLARYGWRTEAWSAYRESLRRAITLRGVAGFLRNLHASAPSTHPPRPVDTRRGCA